jgi:hypothetical protein
MVAGWKPPEILAVHPSIKPENKSFIKEKGNNGQGWKPPEGEEMLAVHPSIDPEKQSLSTEKGKNGHGMETS